MPKSASPKRRLDALLVERGLAKDVAHAAALILAGRILVNERKVDKAGTAVTSDAALRILGDAKKYVSRGGTKLAHGLDTFGLEVSGKIALDVGASTGGFTDCLLQAGAAKVYAVDVGYGQLAEKLRTDPRVVNLERTNIREVPKGAIPEPVDLVVIDASFISLQLVLPPALSFLRRGGDVIALVKPQFEADRAAVEPGGVVRAAETHEQVLNGIRHFIRGLGREVKGLTPSPITGQKKGNVEFLLWA
ncbi:MAG: TlyA family RNA methyltransferase [Deltaproteobacteria bacterium]|nr:TlyA family RNA methyltransferase [Deltaproteobacteria bacterium]